MHESKFPFVSRIEFIRSKLSNFSAHVYGVSGVCSTRRHGGGKTTSPGFSCIGSSLSCVAGSVVIAWPTEMWGEVHSVANAFTTRSVFIMAVLVTRHSVSFFFFTNRLLVLCLGYGRRI